MDGLNELFKNPVTIWTSVAIFAYFFGRGMIYGLKGMFGIISQIISIFKEAVNEIKQLRQALADLVTKLNQLEVGDVQRHSEVKLSGKEIEAKVIELFGEERHLLRNYFTPIYAHLGISPPIEK